jgi:NADH-quinone oxidoreductase subunit C/D
MQTGAQSQSATHTASASRAAAEHLVSLFGERVLAQQVTVDGIPTLWFARDTIVQVLTILRDEMFAGAKFEMLFDLTAIDERLRVNRQGQPASDFTVVYQLMSFSGNVDLRLKVPLQDADLCLPTVTHLWPNANWYEREVWDMFGIRFDGHPNLYRLVLPPTWEGHALRKEHPARATEMEPFSLDDAQTDIEQEALKFKPEEWGMKRASDDSEFMFLNLGPNHPSVHGAFRIAVQLDGEILVDAVPDIGYHHRGAEKMGERQSWHTFIPYTDRIDYLGGVMNNLPYVMAVEKMAGIQGTRSCEDDSHYALRDVSHLQPSAFLRYLRAGCRAALSDLLHVCRARTNLQHHRIDLWSSNASRMVSYRWCGTRPAAGLGQANSGATGIHATPSR